MSDLANDPDGLEDDERTDAETAIAEQIAALSLATDAPSEFEPTGRAIDTAEVDFSSTAWMACLADVQGWLRLPGSLVLDDPENFLQTLADGLGFEDSATAIDHLDQPPRLSLIGLDRLLNRLQRAERLQAEFAEALEGQGASVDSATGQWVDSWNEEDDREEPSEPVTAKADTWPIQDFSDKAIRDRLNLSPSYQRGDVWPTSDSQMLIESILRGIPLPSVIILKPEGAGAAHEVVDGKQRLTAILRFIGKHPEALRTVREADKTHPDAGFERLFQENYPAFRRKWKNVTGQALSATDERALYFPFKLRSSGGALQGNLSGLQGKYYTQIKDERVHVADDEVEVRDLFESTTTYKIPLIEYSKASRRQIHEVFNLYNKQGKHLNAEEIRNAVYHELDLMRALLVTAGDNDDVEAVAPFLVPAWDALKGVSGMLDAYGIGSARYRRTKVLSWLASMLLVDSMEAKGPKRLSTASHINTLLDRVQKHSSDPLRNATTVRSALLLINTGMQAHSAVDDAWSPSFRDTKTGAKWQELQLVASVLGTTLAAVVLGEELVDRLEEHADDLAAATALTEWQRPKKTQTASQWDFISQVALWTVDVLEVGRAEVSADLKRRFGHSCVPTLEVAAPDKFSL
jgi:hypothetical protein